MPKKKKKPKKVEKSSKNYVYPAIGCLALFLGFTNLLLIRKPSSKVLGAQIIKTYSPTLTQEAVYWENIVSKYPTYRDGYLELWDIYSKAGDKAKAENFYKTAKDLDPNNILF